MKLATKLSMAALMALLALSSCGDNRAGDVGTDSGKPNCDLTDPTEDCDEDGLLNGEETEYGTNPELKDTDGDGLWDGNEVKVHFTDPLNPDSDEDSVDDGREVYTCDETTFDTIYPTQNAANNINHEDSPDVIDALDPKNDSDGDGYVNIGEKYAGTDACDPDSHPEPPTCEGIEVVNGVYIPGGFDVDGDGVEETGFWITAYPASVTSSSVTGEYTSFNSEMEEKFNFLEGGSLPYTTGRVAHTNPLYTPQFEDQGSSVDNYMTNIYALDMPLVIEAASIPPCADSANNSYGQTVPTNKQYTQIIQLLKASGDGVTIENNVLGLDPNVNKDYTTKIYYFGDFREFTRDLVYVDGFSAPEFWDVLNVTTATEEVGLNPPLAWTDLDIGFGSPGWLDPIAVVVRGVSGGGSANSMRNVDLTYGVGSGDGSRGAGIVFRVATPYLQNNVTVSE